MSFNHSSSENSSERNLTEIEPQSGDCAWTDLYQQLRQMAARQMRRERSGHLLQTTAIVHEAYFRLAKCQSSNWNITRQGGRGSFLAAAAKTMRRVLIDSARIEKAKKRSGARKRRPLSEAELAFNDKRFSAIEIHDALERLSVLAPDQARALELMIFGGLTGDQVADVMGVSASTVDRRIRIAKAWLRRELSEQR